MNTIGYSFRDGWRLIARHWGMSLLTIFTAMSVFYIIGSSTLFVTNIKNIIATMEDQLTIDAYLNESAQPDVVVQKISKINGILDTQIVTKQMALESLRSRVSSISDSITLLGENPLPNSVVVRVDTASAVNIIAEKLQKMPEVDEVIYAGKVAEKLTDISNFITNFSLLILLIAIVTSGIVLFNTIRISVYSREEEIRVMLMVGATPTYIALPFVIQGILLSFFGVVISYILLVITYSISINKLKELLPFMTFVEMHSVSAHLFFFLVCCGVAISLIASLLAVEKFIRQNSKPM